MTRAPRITKKLWREYQESERQRWITNYLGRPRWTWGEALYWVAYTDADRISHLRNERGSLDHDGASQTAMLLLMADPPNRPVTSLQDALELGRVQAFGSYQGEPPLVPIECSWWRTILVQDGPPELRSRTPALHKNWHKDQSIRLNYPHWWADVEFDRESVMAAFPPAVPSETTGRPSATRRDHPRWWADPENVALSLAPPLAETLQRSPEIGAARAGRPPRATVKGAPAWKRDKARAAIESWLRDNPTRQLREVPVGDIAHKVGVDRRTVARARDDLTAQKSHK